MNISVAVYSYAGFLLLITLYKYLTPVFCFLNYGIITVNYGILFLRYGAKCFKNSLKYRAFSGFLVAGV